MQYIFILLHKYVYGILIVFVLFIHRLRWPNDQRISEVRKLLQSARPVIIGVQQRPEVSDHDFVEEQERNLQSLCIRTMALPVGRGAMAFQCAAPLPTEPVSCLH